MATFILSLDIWRWFTRYADMRRSHLLMSKVFKSSSAPTPGPSKPPAGIPAACFVLGILALLPITQAQTPPPDKDAANKIEPVRTTITVIENLATETPAAVSVLDNKQIRETPGDNLDDRLRTVPGFSLFRRSSSLVAHPTTQGISLRGIGSSGASRTLVIWDSIPASDPFGGWVYWTRFDPDEL